LDKAQEESLMTSDQRAVIDAIYSIRDAHLHFNPHMKTVGKYVKALRRFGLDLLHQNYLNLQVSLAIKCHMDYCGSRSFVESSKENMTTWMTIGKGEGSKSDSP
jgi:hypothetical protein